MKTVEGNLLDLFDQGMFEAILHGCNCHCGMGGGIAAQIAKRYPDAEKVDKQTNWGDMLKLGSITAVQFWSEKYSRSQIVVNCYTQFYGGSEDEKVLYASIRSALQKVAKYFSGVKIGLPQIGCGIAGGNWDIVSKIVEEELCNCDYTVVIYKP